MKRHIDYRFLFLILTIIGMASCKKLIETGEPKNQLTTEKVFETDQSAIAALSNIYGQFNNGLTINGNLTPYMSLYIDELNGTGLSGSNLEFYTGALQTDNSTDLNIWRGFYSVIYQSNALLEGVQNSDKITAVTKTQIRGEAKFLRAFAYFYLVNLYGDVPLLTTTDITSNASAGRATVAQVYNQIQADLDEAKSLLTENYPSAEKVRVNLGSVLALMARVSLYQKNWNDAETHASRVIVSNTYLPLDPVANVFQKNSREAIFQVWTPNGFTSQGALLVLASGTPPYFLTPGFVASYETGDRRKATWVTTISGGAASYPLSSKYKKVAAATGTDGEYLMVLRLSEQFLIRAEARTEQNKLAEALQDINVIRNRAGMPSIQMPVSKDSSFTLLQAERKREFFTEWGHRFFDLKRWNILQTVMFPLKPGWSSRSALLPIPQNEINKNPRLMQNPGY